MHCGLQMAQREFKFCMKCASALAVKTDSEGKPRMACSSSTCNFVWYNNPTPVVGAIVEYYGESAESTASTGDVLLVQNVGWPRDWFGIVTGFLEKGESAVDGVIREVKEELGLHAVVQRFVGVYDFQRLNQVILVWHVQARGKITIPPNEIAAYKRVPIPKLKPWPHGTGQAVSDFLLHRASQLSAAAAPAPSPAPAFVPSKL